MADKTNITDDGDIPGTTVTSLVECHEHGALHKYDNEGADVLPPLCGGGITGNNLTGVVLGALASSATLTPPPDHPPVVVPENYDDVIVKINGTPLGRYTPRPLMAPGLIKIVPIPGVSELHYTDADTIDHRAYLTSLDGQVVDVTWVQPPVATLTSITPGTIARDSGMVSVVATGTNFTRDHVLWAGSSPLLATTDDELPPGAAVLTDSIEQFSSTYVSPTQIDAVLDTSRFAAGALQVWAAQGSSIRSATNKVPLNVTGAPMVLSSVTPSEAPMSATVDLVFHGTGFPAFVKIYVEPPGGTYDGFNATSTEATILGYYPTGPAGAISRFWMQAVGVKSAESVTLTHTAPA